MNTRALLLLLSIALTSCLPAPCQPTIPPAKDLDYDLGIDYGVNFLNGSMKLNEFYTLADVQSKLPQFYARCKYLTWSDAEIMSTRFAEAAWVDATYKAANGLVNVDSPFSAPKIHVGTGKYLITMPLPVCTGIYTGDGSRFCDNSAYQHSFGSTELVMDHANWKTARYPDKMLMRSVNWGSEDALGGWMHHTQIRDFCFNGARRQKTLVQGQPLTALVGMWDMGEASGIYNCYFFDSEGAGLLLSRGTPVHVTDCSFFTNNGYGIECTSSGNFTLTGISGDENGRALIGSTPGYGRPGNGTLTITGFKYETGTSPAAFRPFDGQPFLSIEGWWTVSIDGGTYAVASLTPYCFIHTKGTLNTSSITWSGVQFFGNAPKCIIYDEATDTEYLFNGDPYNTAMDNGTWHTTFGLKNNWPIVIGTNKRTTKGILQHVGVDGATSWATAGIYNPYGAATPPPPVTCTWVLGTETCPTCTTGQVSVTCTTPYKSSVDGCTPTTAKPADVTRVQMCGTPPPPTGGEIASLPSNPVPDKCIKYTIPGGGWGGATKVEITGLRHKYADGSRFICFDQSQAMRIVVDGAGAVWIGGSKKYPDGTLKNDVAYAGTLVFTFPATTIIRMGDSNMGSGNNCNGFTGSWTSLKVYK